MYIIYRSEIHTHADHDGKIKKKVNSKSVYTSLLLAEENVDNFNIHRKSLSSKRMSKKKPLEDL